MLRGADAALARRALIAAHLSARQGLLDPGDLHTVRKLKKLWLHEQQGRVRTALLKVRPLFFGTASGLNALTRIRLAAFPRTRALVLLVLNDMLRGYSEMIYCCNPWCGLLVFFALAIENAWLSLCTFAGCMSSIAAGRALGVAPGLLSFGLIQFRCMFAAQAIGQRNMQTPPQDLSWESAKLARCFSLISVSSLWITVLVIGPSGLLLPTIKVSDYGLVQQLGLTCILLWGASNELFDNGFGRDSYPPQWLLHFDPVDSYGAESLDHVDWSQAAHAIFRSTGSTVWLKGTPACALIWIGIILTSPLFALWFAFGATVGQLTLIYGGASASVVHAGLGLWNPAMVALCIGCMVNVPSGSSVLYSAIAASFTVALDNALSMVFSVFELPCTISHALASIIFTLLRFTKTRMVPVDIIDSTVAEDHLYQYSMANTCIDELAEVVNRALGPRPDRSSASLATREAWSLRKLATSAVDLLYMVLSFGAFSRSELTTAGGVHVRDLKRAPFERIVETLRRVFALLAAAEVDDETDAETFPARVLALLLLSGEVSLTAEGIQEFRSRWDLHSGSASSCYLCGKVGHWSHECPSSKKQTAEAQEHAKTSPKLRRPILPAIPSGDMLPWFHRIEPLPGANEAARTAAPKGRQPAKAKPTKLTRATTRESSMIFALLQLHHELAMSEKVLLRETSVGLEQKPAPMHPTSAYPRLQVGEFFRLFDPGGRGTITEYELVSALSGISDDQEDLAPRVAHIFRVADADGNGSISKAELRAMLLETRAEKAYSVKMWARITDACSRLPAPTPTIKTRAMRVVAALRSHFESDLTNRPTEREWSVSGPGRQARRGRRSRVTPSADNVIRSRHSGVTFA